MTLDYPEGNGPAGTVPDLLVISADRGIAMAPNVAAALCRDLAGDLDAALEVAGVLSPGQLAGHSALPDPLPLLPGLAARLGSPSLSPADRELLLAAAVCVEDRTEVLLTLAHGSMAELIGGPLGPHLQFVAGHFSFADPRMRLWIHETATQAERTNAHVLMQHAYAGLGRRGKAVWHQSLATLEGDTALVPALLELSREAELAGNAVWAHAIAREAASHANGPAVLDSHLACGAAALKLGLVSDAVAWLAPVLDAADPQLAALALAPYIHAEALLTGEVPTVLAERRATSLLAAVPAQDGDGATRVLRSVAKACGLAAGLCAAGGRLEDAGRFLAQAEALVEENSLEGLPLCAARGWCALFGVPGANASRCCRQGQEGGVLEFSDVRVVMEALTMGMADDAGAGLRLLQAGPCVAGPGGGTPGSGGARRGSIGQLHRAASPLGMAYRAVAASLLHFWQGDAARAAAELELAMTVFPAGLPLSGLGVALARRLDVVTNGKVGPMARALGAGCPISASSFIRTADLTDRALTAYFEGNLLESSTLGRLAVDRAARGASFPLFVPGFDETGPDAPPEAGARDDSGSPGVPAAGAPADPTTGAVPVPGPLRLVPDGHRRAAEARRLLRSTDSDRFSRDYSQAQAASAGLSSPYERARTEFVLGQACLRHDHAAMAREHLVVAADLFRETGTPAWQTAVDNMLDSLAGHPGVEAQLPAPHTGPLHLADIRAAHAATLLAVQTGMVPRVPEAPRAVGHPLPVGPLDECRTVWAELLTERELEVAMLVVDGASNRQAAATLHVSVRTVEVHLGRVFHKLQVRSRVELSVAAHRMGAGWSTAAT
ncbi:DNA-binding CsgD family transcriptional regulator [Arthrobacter stackebrandtii]|uniref:DNA-binding CsgD family transcriptional regulator n=1 Tax=Arthrobacter stackebrandtii TaxID=272161 RepID=A0ABS4YUF2_9MICC|nr:helix-turn-helix transcriptional regulator [Arthrobacter stackebrandtii]MBP2412421.1 DNA-binding CsgD family transcriptional regulator [Arthrobacter stackebrandtii]PYH02187.1 hypothetical protein CVV67_01755 [Arthrobacter stackebrandtii]